MFNMGDEVRLAGHKFAGLRFRVVKVNPTTYRVSEIGNSVRIIRASHSLILPPLPRDGQPVACDLPPTVLPPQQHFTCGQVVRWRGAKEVAGIEPNGLGVVLADKYTHVNVAKLGGHRDRYIKAPHALIEAVTDMTTLVDVIQGR
jgi:hypothetical protein